MTRHSESSKDYILNGFDDIRSRDIGVWF